MELFCEENGCDMCDEVGCFASEFIMMCVPYFPNTDELFSSAHRTCHA
jgi:hypothetical protein